MGRRKKKKTPGKRVSKPQAVDANLVRVAREESREKPEAGGDDPKELRAGAAVLGAEVRSVWTPLLTGLLIFLIASPSLVGPYGQKGGYTPDLHMAAYIQVGALLILSLFLISCFARKQITISRSPVLLPLLIFYAWAILSVLWADTKYEAVVDALDWGGAFLCAVLITLLLRELKLLKQLLFFLLISGLLMALLGIGQYLFGIDWVQQHIVPAATFSNKNMAGQYGVLTLPIAVAFFLHSKENEKTWFFAAVIALIMTYIFYTRSRGALISLTTEIILLGGLLIYLKRKHNFNIFGDMPVKKVALAASLALFVGMSYLTPAMFGNVEKVKVASIGSKPELLAAEHGGKNLEHVLNFSGSGETRTTMWANSIPMFRDNFLIGVGLGNWTIHYAEYQSWFKPDKSLMQNKYHANAHNDYIEILCELGIIGFALFVWVVVSLFRLMRRLLVNHDEEYFLLTMALILAIMGIAVNAVFSFPLKQPVPIFIVMVYIGVLSNLYGMKLEAGREHTLSLPPVPFRALAAGLAILLTVGIFALQYNWYKSELHYRNAVIHLKKGEYKHAYVESSRAYELNPLRASLLWLDATALMQIGRRASYDTVVEVLEEVDRARPYSSSTLENLASAYSRAGRNDEAADAMGSLLALQPSKNKLRYRYGTLLFKAGRFEKAIKELNASRVSFPGKWTKEREILARIEQMIETSEQRIREKKTSGAPADAAPANAAPANAAPANAVPAEAVPADGS